MGSHISTEQNNNPNNVNDDKKDLCLTFSSLGNNMTDSSIYNEIILDISIINNQSNNYINDRGTKYYSIPKPSSTNFIWNEGGSEVYITGTFCDWKKRFKMAKNLNNIFEIKFQLAKGFYEFKFIVDGVWRCSSYYPHKKDNEGNNNNYIDTKNINNNLDLININNKSLNKTGNLEDLKKFYANIYPEQQQLNVEAPKTPDVFEILMDLNENSNQKYIGSLLNYNFSFFNFDESYKSILPPFHSYLNHLFIYDNMKFIKRIDREKDDSSLNRDKKAKTYFGINCNIKIKNKYISIVYYSPLKKT